jgi:HSP20 family protein
MATLVRWDPVREVAAMHTELSRLMNGLFEGGNGTRQAQSWVPAVDVWETDDAIVYAFDLPGVAQDEISVEAENGALTVTATRSSQLSSEGQGIHRAERRFGTFTRTVGLPQGISDESIEASYTNGVLEIKVPKPEQPKPKRIEVTVDGTPTHPTIEGGSQS